MVEPLGLSCIMLADTTGDRQRELAQLLYALAQGFSELHEYIVCYIPLQNNV